MRYTYLIFDFDGTLADSSEVQLTVLNELAKKHHFAKFTPEDYKNRDTMPLTQKLQMLSLILKLQSEFTLSYGRHIAKVKPIGELLSFLPLLQAYGYQIVVLSSNTEENITKFFKLHHVPPDIPVISSKGLFNKHKAFSEFIKQRQCKADDILYIGDEIRDIKACSKSGIDMVFVKWGLDGDRDISSYKVKYTTSSPVDLKNLLIQQAGR